MIEPRVYSGTRKIELHSHDANKSTGNRGETIVTVNGEPLFSVNDITNYQDSFEWACKNSQATNLAESILYDYLRSCNPSEEIAVPEELYIPFRNDVIFALNFESWKIEEWVIQEWITATVDLLENPEQEESQDEFETIEE